MYYYYYELNEFMVCDCVTRSRGRCRAAAVGGVDGGPVVAWMKRTECRPRTASVEHGLQRS